ncbi:unnamed protein product, partial [Meganyctiphanes norvegica]
MNRIFDLLSLTLSSLGSNEQFTPPKKVGQRCLGSQRRWPRGHQKNGNVGSILVSIYGLTLVFMRFLGHPVHARVLPSYSSAQLLLRDKGRLSYRPILFIIFDQIINLDIHLNLIFKDPQSDCLVYEMKAENIMTRRSRWTVLATEIEISVLLRGFSGAEIYDYFLQKGFTAKKNSKIVQKVTLTIFLSPPMRKRETALCMIIGLTPRSPKNLTLYSKTLIIPKVTDFSATQIIILNNTFEIHCCRFCCPLLLSHRLDPRCLGEVVDLRGNSSAARNWRFSQLRFLVDQVLSRVYMELFAVVCIETSHYVAFTRCGSGPDATWCFFDSMADRKGEQHGYNIPTVTECGDLMQWVGEEGSQMLHALTDNKALPDLPRRLLCDAYMCLYQSPKVMMYR